jgi:hypothetical protein
MYPNVHNFHTSAPSPTSDDASNQVVQAGAPRFKVSQGAYEGEAYGASNILARCAHWVPRRPVRSSFMSTRPAGLRLAAATGFPADVLEHARAVSEQVRPSHHGAAARSGRW